MNPTFTLKLDQQILSGLVVAGKFDGKIPSLACATTGGKILIHSPHEVSNADGRLNSIRYLNLNRKITALASGSLAQADATHRPDFIYVGSQSNLLGYDVERNADAFFVDVQDGVNSLVLGKLGTSQKPMVIAGGNCSVLGFDYRGSESFWTVTGDNVSAMALCDLDSNGQPLLLVGSDDFEIRVFQQEELVSEITEAEKVTMLSTVGSGGKFAYGLANGTVGVYTGAKNRLWRVKTKNKVTAVHAYDLDMDGVQEIFSGWNNGGFNVRREENGEVIFRHSMDAPIAAILTADYRMDGKEEVMICSESGEILGYLASDVELKALAENSSNSSSSSNKGSNAANAADQRALTELQNQKLELLAEMKLLERAAKASKSADVPVGMLPSNTALNYILEGDLLLGAVTLTVEVNTDVQIVNLVAVDLEGVVLVDREVIAVSPRPQSKSAVLPLRPSKYSPCSIRVQTHVATRSLGAHLHIFETIVTLPKFAAFKHVDDPSYYQMPVGKVTFALRDSLDRMLSWIRSVFLVPKLIKSNDGQQRLFFVSLCDPNNNNNNNAKEVNIIQKKKSSNSQQTNESLAEMQHQILVISMQNVSDAGQQSFLRVRLQCNNMDLAAELVQDIGKYFKIDGELESEADFPADFKQFEEVLKRVAECNAARVNLAADMADDSQRIKALVIRAEDARLMLDMHTMRTAYTQLSTLNAQLVGAYNVRAQNQENLLAALKEVNQMIQRAANLRMGKAKARVIADCRNAVKTNNMNSLFRIIRQGYEPNNNNNIAQSK